MNRVIETQHANNVRERMKLQKEKQRNIEHKNDSGIKKGKGTKLYQSNEARTKHT